MSIKQGDYLKKLRNEKGLSQEKLAERLGISRQSISKWEQGTATPDTENLLKLSNLYGVSADVILNCGEVPSVEAAPEKSESEVAGGESPASSDASPGSTASPESTASEAEVTVSAPAGVKEEIHTASMPQSEKREEKAEKPGKKRSWVYVAFPFFAVLAAAAVGALFNGWWYCWLILLLIPLFYTLVQAVERKNAVIFCYPVLVALIYFIFGFMYQIWHPLWLIFLTIPIYYVITVISHRNRKSKNT